MLFRSQSTLPFCVGVADSVPKSVAYRVLEPVLRLPETVRIVCREGTLVSLLAELSVHRLDLVIADRPMPPDVKVRAYNHLLGKSGVSIFAAPPLARALKAGFPKSLDGAPFLMPSETVALRGSLEQWFHAERVRPRIVGEFDDSALLKAFGQGGSGAFAAPTAMSDYICRQYHVDIAGCMESVTEELYAITTERRIRQPAVIVVSEAASQHVFGVAAVSMESAASTSAKSGKFERGPTKRNGMQRRPRKSARA